MPAAVEDIFEYVPFNVIEKRISGDGGKRLAYRASEGFGKWPPSETPEGRSHTTWESEVMTPWLQEAGFDVFEFYQIGDFGRGVKLIHRGTQKRISTQYI